MTLWILPAAGVGQAIDAGAVPASQPTPPTVTAIAKGELGPAYVDGSFGFSVRPLAGAVFDRRKRIVESRTQLAQFVRLDVGWSMAVRLWTSVRPIDVQAARQAMDAALVLDYPDISVTRADEVRVASRPSVRLTATFSDQGKLWLRQQAVIPLRDKSYVLIILTVPQADRAAAEPTFDRILDSFQVLRTQLQQEQLERALSRGTELMGSLAGKSMIAKLNPVIYLRTTRDGNPIGFVEIEERGASIAHRDGLHVAQRAWLFNPDGSVQYVQEDKFTAEDLAYDEWRNFSQIMPSQKADPKQKLVVSIEGGIRERNQLMVEFSTQVGVTDKQDKAIQVDRSYAPSAWPLILPRRVDLKDPEVYAFSMYDSERRGLILRVLRIVGATQSPIAGRRISAYRIEDSEGLVSPISTIDVDDAGRLLRLSSGTVEMTATTKEQIDQEFGPRVKATRDHFRAGLPPMKAMPNDGSPSGESPQHRAPAINRPGRKTEPQQPR